jgi:ADP-ribose pyrophosphatase
VKPDESRTVYEGSMGDLVVERWGDREREIVKHPGVVAIVAVDRERRLWLVRQLREAVRKEVLELPAGRIEEGEDPLASAKRELKEECGLEGGEWCELGAFYASPGFTDERIVVFAAEELEVGDPDPDEDEDLHVERWRADEIGARIDELEDAKTVAGLLLYLRASR